MKKSLSLATIMAAAMVVTGCATNITPTRKTNPAPAAEFSAFKAYKLESLTISDEYAGSGANKKAAKKIQENLQDRIAPLVANWNAESDDDDPRGTLVIQPHVHSIKFIGGAARFWVGSMAGSSAVIMEAEFVEEETGEKINSAQFYQHAAAVGGTYSMGATDNMMLHRIVMKLQEYMLNNYSEAVGGPVQ